MSPRVLLSGLVKILNQTTNREPTARKCRVLWAYQCYAKDGESGIVADVAELADALDLGSSARKGVGVQVSPSAPTSYDACPQATSRVVRYFFPPVRCENLIAVAPWIST